jgi:lipid II:glycine glycyltransferase (peptidoglycan interpeptide bridge formation enzyme)
MAELMKECNYFKLPGDNISPPGTAVLDLNLSEEELFQKFDRTKRRKIRAAQKTRLEIYRGSRDDIADAYHILSSTAERKDFSMPPMTYFYDAWDALAPDNQVAFFISRFEGVPLSTLFVLPFGETVTLWRSGWNRQHGELHPNDATYWTAMQWAKSMGYQKLDFGGLHINTARAILKQADADRKDFPGYDVFKLEFNAKVILHPETYLYFPSPLLRFVYRLSQPFIPMIMSSRIVQKLLAKLSRG